MKSKVIIATLMLTLSASSFASAVTDAFVNAGSTIIDAFVEVGSTVSDAFVEVGSSVLDAFENILSSRLKEQVMAVQGDALNFLAGDEATLALDEMFNTIREVPELAHLSDEQIAKLIVSAK